jgi:hypothetical protein
LGYVNPHALIEGAIFQPSTRVSEGEARVILFICLLGSPNDARALTVDVVGGYITLIHFTHSFTD